MGSEVKGVIGFLDGWKRIIMLAFFLVNGVAAFYTHHDHLALLNTLFSVLGWNPADGVVDGATLTVFLGGAVAVIDGVTKEVRRIRARQGTVTLPKA